MWGATQVRGQRVRASGYFNPRSPCGERPLAAELLAKEGIFQSTLPVWGATVAPGAFSDTLGISIHAPRVGSDERGECMPSPENIISIHAPRVGSDGWPASPPHQRAHFNPRSPCGERRRRAKAEVSPLTFQSTLPVWGATGYQEAWADYRYISIHAPRVGSDSQRSSM